MANVTIKMVAKEAGCSVMSVSNVLNRNGKASPEMAEKVMRVVDKLGYRPNQTARKLVAKRQAENSKVRRFGCVIPSNQNQFSDPYYGEVIDAIKEELRRRKYDLAYIEKEDEFDYDFRRSELLDETTVDGLIVLDCNPEFLDMVSHSECKNIVRVGACISSTEIDYVTANMFDGAREAVKYLIDLGHQNIAYFGFRLDEKFISSEREGGYQVAMSLANPPLPLRPVYMPESSDPNQIFEAAMEMLKANPDLTAVFCHNDTVASMALKAAWSQEKRVPNDISVVGFNNDTISQLSYPALTTVEINKKDIGRIVAQCAVERIENPSLPPRVVLSRCELVKRDSCACRDMS